MKRAGLIFGLGLVLVGFAMWWYAPGQVVKRKSVKLLEIASFERGSGKAGRSMGVHALGRMLGEDVHLEAPVEGIAGSFSRSEIESGFLWLAEQVKQSRFEPTRTHHVSVRGDEAEVSLRVVSLLELPTRRLIEGEHEVVFRWHLEEDGWRLVQATWNEAGE